MRPKPPKTASEFADWLAQHTGYGALVGFIEDDGSGSGVFVQLGYTGLSIEDAEFVAGTLLRDLQRQLTGPNSHDCDECRRRVARISDALAAIERDGAMPTGLTRERTH